MFGKYSFPCDKIIHFFIDKTSGSLINIKYKVVVYYVSKSIPIIKNFNKFVNKYFVFIFYFTLNYDY